jgi:hypothetical protein
MSAQLDSAVEQHNAGLERFVSGYRPLPGIFDEMMDSDGRARALAAVPVDACCARQRRDQSPVCRRRPLSARFRRFLSRLRGCGRHRAAVAAQSYPAIIEPNEWAELEAGLIQRAELLEAVLADTYGPATLTARRPAARGADRRQSGILASAGRRRAARRRASALLCRRCRARRRRPLVGAQRSRPGAVRRRLRHREPARSVARHSRHLSHHARRARRAVLPGLSGRIVRAEPQDDAAPACSRPAR